MKKLILHVGMPKTGTSAIQYFLEMNQSVLGGNGFAYPGNGTANSNRSTTGNAGELNRLARQESEDPQEVFFKRFKKLVESEECVSADNVILSNEGLHRLASGFHSRIKEYCDAKNIDVQIVFYLRVQSELLESGFLQRSKSGRVKFDDYFQVWSGKMNYLGFLDKLSEVYGRAALSVRRYGENLYRSSIVYDFCQLVNLETSNLDCSQASARINLTPSLSELSIVLYIAELRGSVDKKFWNFIQQCSMNCGNRELDDSDKFRFSDKFVLKLKSLFDKDNKVVSEKYLNGEPFEIVARGGGNMGIPELSAMEKTFVRMLFGLYSHRRGKNA
ncbi:MAG: hypothetical protein ACI9YE_000854 [Psychroserpens sp.]|jgi:hypothetical protein